MNTFSYSKCHSFGFSLGGYWTKSWGELQADPGWIEFKNRRELTENQLYYVHLGFIGKPFESTQHRDAGLNMLSDELISFGKHKGQKLGSLSENYIRWLASQEWLPKWPTVQEYVKIKIEKLDESKLSKDDIANLLKL